MKTTLKINEPCFLPQGGLEKQRFIQKKKIKSYDFYNGKIVLQKKGGFASEASRGACPPSLLPKEGISAFKKNVSLQSICQ